MKEVIFHSPFTARVAVDSSAARPFIHPPLGQSPLFSLGEPLLPFLLHMVWMEEALSVDSQAIHPLGHSDWL